MNRDIIHDEVISISLQKVINYGISVEQYVFVFLIYKQQRWKLGKYITFANIDSTELALSLLELGYIKQSKEGDNYSLNNLDATEDFVAICTGTKEPEVLENWISEWYDLWPTGIKSGGYYLRTDKKGVLRKMKTFLVYYPQYSKKIVMEATKNYLNDQSLGGYSYTKLAPYFIEKDGMSVLAGECENIEDNEGVVINKYEGYGGEEI